MSTEQRPAHSPLGASGAERWLQCPGSVNLLKRLDIPEESDEPEYRSMGTSAHGAADKCLKENLEAWEVAGETFGKHKVDQEMEDAVRMYLDECRKIISPGSIVHVEFGLAAPDFHKDFYGTLDFGVVSGALLRIRDFKYGAGIAVDATENPQLMYYAYGLLRHHPEVAEVEFGIVQPRAFHSDGPIRIAPRMSADALHRWANETLKPAMIATALDHDLDAGKWCRFCPAKLVCPLMESLFGMAMTQDPKRTVELTDASLGRSYQYIDAVEFYIKALEAETLRRLQAGGEVPGTKLVNKKANRVWKPGSDTVFRMKYGPEAYTKPELLSPSEMSKKGDDAKAMVTEWAFTPQSGYTVAGIDDKRPAVVIKTAAETFGSVINSAITE